MSSGFFDGAGGGGGVDAVARAVEIGAVEVAGVVGVVGFVAERTAAGAFPAPVVADAVGGLSTTAAFGVGSAELLALAKVAAESTGGVGMRPDGTFEAVATISRVPEAGPRPSSANAPAPTASAPTTTATATPLPIGGFGCSGEGDVETPAIDLAAASSDFEVARLGASGAAFVVASADVGGSLLLDAAPAGGWGASPELGGASGRSIVFSTPLTPLGAGTFDAGRRPTSAGGWGASPKFDAGRRPTSAGGWGASPNFDCPATGASSVSGGNVSWSGFMTPSTRAMRLTRASSFPVANGAIAEATAATLW